MTMSACFIVVDHTQHGFFIKRLGGEIEFSVIAGFLVGHSHFT
jgi:hypothetical protein